MGKLPSTNRLIELYKSHSLRQIAKMYDCHHSRVAHCLRGVDTSKPDLTQRNEEIRALYADNVPVYVIADRFNLSEKSIYRICSGVAGRKWTINNSTDALEKIVHLLQDT